MPSRILFVSDSPAIASGQARVVRELAIRFLQAKFHVAVAGWFHPGGEFPYRVYGIDKRQPSTLAQVLDAEQPDTVVAIGDPWSFTWLGSRKVETRKFQLVGYLNIEGAPIAPSMEQTLDAFDRIITTSEFGRQTVSRAHVVEVHHGVDRDVFTPIEPPTEIFGRKVAETFVVLVNGQNTYRKNLAAAIEGFAILAKAHDNVLCYVNSVPAPGPGDAKGSNLIDLVLELGLKNHVVFNPDNRGPLDTIDDEAMNRIYGFSDVLLVTSCNEGFCLPLLEAMATKTVPIAPDSYSASELLADGRGVLIPVNATFRNQQGMQAAMVAAEDVGSVLIEAYDDWKHKDLERYHQAGMAFAISRSWDRCYEQIAGELAVHVPRRAGSGQAMAPYLRMHARDAAMRYPDTFGVMKMGGLGDMLQTTAVIRAAARKFNRKAVVFCDGYDEVFLAMDEVEAVVRVATVQEIAVASIADEFPIFLDVRYVSWPYGVETPTFAARHRWFYADWTRSNGRIGTLGLHTTEIMLRSLGLEDYGDIRPVYTPRTPTTAQSFRLGRLRVNRPESNRSREDGLPERFWAVASGAGKLGALKLWPSQYWDQFPLHFNPVLVQIGGKEDPGVPAMLDARGLSLPETAYILERSQGLIATEGGMVHLAAAVGRRSVVIFGPTPVSAFGYPQNVNLGPQVCQPCFYGGSPWSRGECAIGSKTCINFVGPEVVGEALRRGALQVDVAAMVEVTA